MMFYEVSQLINTIMEYLDINFSVKVDFETERDKDEIYSTSIHLYDYKHVKTFKEGEVIWIEIFYEKDGDDRHKVIKVSENERNVIIELNSETIKFSDAYMEIIHSYEDGFTIRLHKRTS